MRTEIVVALIGAGALSVQVVANYLINRQSANDLRTNIDREIDIIRKLRPGSDEARKLQEHVSTSINNMIDRDQRRDLASENLRISGLSVVVALAFYGLGVWREHGVPKDLRVIVDVLYWGLILLLLAILWQAARYYYFTIRRWFRIWRAKREIAKLEKKKAEMKAAMKAEMKAEKAKGFSIIDASRKRMEALAPFKAQIIDTAGQEAWDEIEKAHKVGEEVWNEFENEIEKAYTSLEEQSENFPGTPTSSQPPEQAAEG